MVHTENYVPLNRVKIGETYSQIFLVIGSRNHKGSGGDPYLILTVRDVTGELTLFVWGVSALIKPNTYIYCSAEAKEFKSKLVLTTTNITPVPRPKDVDLFIKGEATSTLDVVRAEIEGLMDKVYDNDIGLIYKHFAELNLLQLMAVAPFGEPSSRLMHAGGLLIHTFNLNKLAVAIANSITQTDINIDKDLLRMGCLCRNLGYMTSYELKGDIWTVTEYGTLFGIRDASWTYTRDILIGAESAFKISLPAGKKFGLMHLAKVETPLTAEGRIILSAEDILNDVYARRS
jgi:hypothetical protein